MNVQEIPINPYSEYALPLRGDNSICVDVYFRNKPSMDKVLGEVAKFVEAIEAFPTGSKFVCKYFDNLNRPGYPRWRLWLHVMSFYPTYGSNPSGKIQEVFI